MSCKDPEEHYCAMCDEMGGYSPRTLKSIKELNPDFMETLHAMDKFMTEDRALERRRRG